jgi:NAD(P)-dependent dehydrogenase (short-subunit alcohol dehydrogenase family)
MNTEYNPFTLVGKTILVTGASSGIGRAAAIECSKLGAKVVITARNEQRLKETYDSLVGDGHSMLIADLSEDNQIDILVDGCPSLDGLVNNAGITETLMTPFIKREKLMKVLETNTIAPILLTQRLLKKKRISRGGSIVFTGSISGTCVCVGGNVLYSASKGAIHGFVKNAALDLSIKGIRVNEVCPGMINTHIMDSSSIDEEQLKIEAQKYPMKRFGKPEEVAYGIIYLLSDASSFMTGSSIVIDGGFTLQ